MESLVVTQSPHAAHQPSMPHQVPPWQQQPLKHGYGNVASHQIPRVPSNGGLQPRTSGRSTPGVPIPALTPPAGGGLPPASMQHQHFMSLPQRAGSTHLQQPLHQYRAPVRSHPVQIPVAESMTQVTNGGGSMDYYAATPAGVPPLSSNGSRAGESLPGSDAGESLPRVNGSYDAVSDHSRDEVAKQSALHHQLRKESCMQTHPHQQQLSSMPSQAPVAAAATAAPVVPASFRCALTGQVMHDPVATCDGQVYELTAIEDWFHQGHRSSPLTGVELETLTLTPQFALQAAVQAFMSHPAAPQSAARTFSSLEKSSTFSTASSVADPVIVKSTTSTSSTAVPVATPVRSDREMGHTLGARPYDGVVEEDPRLRPFPREDGGSCGNGSCVAPSRQNQRVSEEAGSAVSSVTASPGTQQQQQTNAFSMSSAIPILPQGAFDLSSSLGRQGAAELSASTSSRPAQIRQNPSPSLVGFGAAYGAANGAQSAAGIKAPPRRNTSPGSRASGGGGNSGWRQNSQPRSRSPDDRQAVQNDEVGRDGEFGPRRGSSPIRPASQRGARRLSPGPTQNSEAAVSSPASGRSAASRPTPRRPTGTAGYGNRAASGASTRATSPGSQARAAAGTVAANAQAAAASAPGLSSPSGRRSEDGQRRNVGLIRRTGLGGGASASNSAPAPAGSLGSGGGTRRTSSPQRNNGMASKQQQHQQQQVQQQRRQQQLMTQPLSGGGGGRSSLGGSRSRPSLEGSSGGPVAADRGTVSCQQLSPENFGVATSPDGGHSHLFSLGAPGDVAAGSRLEVLGGLNSHGFEDLGVGFAPSALGRVEKVPEEDEREEEILKAEEEEEEAAAREKAEAEDRFDSRQRDVDSTDEAGRTPLMHAAGEGEPEALRYLITRGASVDAVDECRCTALMYAATYGHRDAVKCLVEHGAAVEATSKDGWTPLVTAAYNGHIEVVRFLLARGARIEAADERGWTSLMHVAFNGDNQTLRCLLDGRADVDALDSDGRTALVYAAFNGHLDNVRCLLESGNQESGAPPADGARDTALLFAAIHGHEDVVRVLLEVAAASPETRHAALKLAADHGHHAVVELLVRRSAVELQLGGR